MMLKFSVLTAIIVASRELGAADPIKWSCFEKPKTTDDVLDSSLSILSAYDEINNHLQSDKPDLAQETLKQLIAAPEVKDKKKKSTNDDQVKEFKLFYKVVTNNDICGFTYVKDLGHIAEARQGRPLAVDRYSSVVLVDKLVNNVCSHQAKTCRDNYSRQFQVKNLKLRNKQLTIMDTFTHAVIKRRFAENTLLDSKLLIDNIIFQNERNILGEQEDHEAGREALKLLVQTRNYKHSVGEDMVLLLKNCCIYYANQMEQKVFSPSVFGLKFAPVDLKEKPNDEFYGSLARCATFLFKEGLLILIDQIC